MLLQYLHRRKNKPRKALSEASPHPSWVDLWLIQGIRWGVAGCIAFFLLFSFYTVTQWSLYQRFESQFQRTHTLSIEHGGDYFAVDIHGAASPEQVAIIEESIQLFPRQLIEAFSFGREGLHGLEKPLSIFILGKESFKNVSPWYHKKSFEGGLEGFYSDEKIFIHAELDPQTFRKAMVHELVHALDDYLLQGPTFRGLLKENGYFVEPIANSILHHKRRQANKVYSHLRTQGEVTLLNHILEDLFDPKLFSSRVVPKSQEELQSVRRALECCFVSMYSLAGDMDADEVSEYFAENYMAFLLKPQKLRNRDPRMFYAIKQLDSYFRTMEGRVDAERGAYLFSVYLRSSSEIASVF